MDGSWYNRKAESYSNDAKKRTLGTDFIINKRVKPLIIDFCVINPRMCIPRLK